MPGLSSVNAIYTEIKTHSVCDRRNVDPCEYAGNWSTDVWVVGYAIGDGGIKLWHPGAPVPPELMEAIANGAPVISYDAPFHRALFIGIMGPRYGWPVPPLEQWICTAATATAMNLPDSLDDAAKAMGIAEPRDKEVRNLLRRMARPRSKTKIRCHVCGMMTCDHHKMFKTSLVWWNDGEDLARLDGYCVEDVRTGRALFSALRPLSESQREEWLRVQSDNEREFLALVSAFTATLAEGPVLATNATPQGAAEIVAKWIRGHIGLIHMLAESLAGQGKVIATAFGENPDETDPRTGKTGRAVWPKVIQAEIGDVKATLDGLAQVVKRPHYNLYMSLAVFRPDIDPRSKGFERDVVACLGIVADFDDPDAGRWAGRLPLPPNYVIQSSAGRYQALYLFDKPEPPEVVKPPAERLKAFAGCDHGTSDVSHVWRIPGALNWPNAKKVAGGRSRDPQLVRVEMFSDTRTSLQALSDALSNVEVTSEPKQSRISSKAAGAQANGKGDQKAKNTVHSPHRAAVEGSPENLQARQLLLSLPTELQEQITQPIAGDRSKAIFRVVTNLIAQGLDDKAIEILIYAHPKAIGAKYANRDDLDKEIARVRKKTVASPQGNAVAQGDVIAALVSEMNRRYSVVDDHGKTVIVYRKEDTDLDRKYVVRASYQDFRNLYLNTQVRVPNPSSNGFKTITHAELWLAHPQRKTYNGGLRFLPGTYEGPSDVYNLWTGWGVDPKPGDWSKMKAHTNEVLCSGSAEYFEYVMNWLARAVQKPGEAGEVALVLRGARGAGKGIFARTFGALFGQHFLHLSNARHLTGNFNAHLRDACVIFADEAFYAGDKQHEGQLKRLVTEPTLMIEAKYANAVPVPNRLHLIVASNDDWVVPAGTDERRFFVLDVSSIRRSDYEYFGAVEEELKTGGRAAMLHELLHRDISRFNVRSVPNTVGLSDQKIRSLRGFEAWWYETLEEGNLAGIVSMDGAFSAVEEPWTEAVTVNRDALYQDYVQFSKDRKEYRPDDKSRLGKFLRKYVPGLAEERPRLPGTNCRARLYRLPPLSECRTEFEKVIGSVEWDNA